MGSLSDTYESLMLDAILGGSHSGVFPATVYLALFTVACDDDTFGTEVTGGSYARVALTNNDTNFPDAVGGTKTNGVDINFPTASGTWGTVVGWAIMDHATDDDISDVIIWGEFATGVTIVSGQAPTIVAGALAINGD